MSSLAEMLAGNPLEVVLGELSWAIPLIQSIHILAIAALVGAALVINLRLIGVLESDGPLRAVSRRFMPVFWIALAVLLVTGGLMILSEPDRALLNAIFRLKMVMLVALTAIILAEQSVMRRAAAIDRRVPEENTAISVWRAGSVTRTAAWLALLLLVGIVLCGRWIAYT